MADVLNAKKQEVISTLIDNLSSRNKDFEACLNAQLVLLELVDSDQLFPKLIEVANVKRLLAAACDIRN
jgi:hypothetical protein